MTMQSIPQETAVLSKLVSWAANQNSIRAMIITSSLARPDGPVDLLSDYDIILIVTNAEELGRDSNWLSDYGQPLVRWGDQSELYGLITYFRSAIYEDYIKIDYSIWPVGLLERISAESSLPEELDAGYKILLDKDGRTSGWKSPSYQAFIPAKPTEAEYQEVIETFWWTTSYVAKSLWRDELVFVKFCLDFDIKLDVMRRMLEWRIEIDHNWSLRPGVYGRRFKQLLPANIWLDLEGTYTGPEIEDNWSAFFNTINLFRRVAIEVGDALGYSYPHQLDERMEAYLNTIRHLPRNT